MFTGLEGLSKYRESTWPTSLQHSSQASTYVALHYELGTFEARAT